HSSVARGNGSESPTSSPLPALLTLRPASLLEPWAELTLGQLAELIAFQRRTVAELGPCSGERCAEVIAAQRILQGLNMEFGRRAAQVPVSPKRRLPRKRLKPDVLKFQRPPLRQGQLGALAYAAQWVFMTGLKPFHVETLRPQQWFNDRLVMLLNELLS